MRDVFGSSARTTRLNPPSGTAVRLYGFEDAEATAGFGSGRRYSDRRRLTRIATSAWL
jgi:hypothetical protein